MTGFFISFEGLDGSGKSTQTKMLQQYLISKGKDVLLSYEPGGTIFGEKIREILTKTTIHPMTEVMLYAAARNEHVKNFIIPSLQSGKIVICDRFFDSSIAYQGYGRGICVEEIISINNYVLSGIMPNITILLDANSEILRKRLNLRPYLDEIESEKDDFYIKVKKGYMKLLEQNPNRIFCVDAEQSAENTHLDIIKILGNVIKI